MSEPINLKGLSDREACTDTILRFVEGIDDASEQLLESAFTEDAFFDLTAVSVIGAEFGTVSTRKNIVPHLMKSVGTSMDSLHQVTNFRINVEGDSAQLSCHVLAQHYRPGEGSALDKPDKLLMGNRIRAGLVRADGGLWRIQKLQLRNQWAEGTLDLFKH